LQSGANVKTKRPASFGSLYEGDSDQRPVSVLPETVPSILPSSVA